jgi:hypothetical protein
MEETPEGIRDAYGFAVSKEYEELYKTYASLYEAEEEERFRHWNDLLELYEPGISTSDDERGRDALLAQIFQEAVDDVKLEGRLRSLIQSGIPLKYRGTVWKLLLDVDNRKVEGEYQDLVCTALGEEAFVKPQAAADASSEPVSRKSKATGVRQWAPPSKDWLSQIEKDLHRTFPGHWMMDEEGGCITSRAAALMLLPVLDS